MAYRLTRKALILDLHAAFQLAKRHKSNKPYVQHFERNLKRNIEQLADDLLNRTYKPEPSTVFIVERPKKREVFAAQFRDRVVHHLYYNYTRLFLEDPEPLLQEIQRRKDLISQGIVHILSTQKLQQRTCPSCRRRLPWNWPYRLCDACHSTGRRR